MKKGFLLTHNDKSVHHLKHHINQLLFDGLKNKHSYVYSSDHQKAIDLYDVLGDGLTCHYESEEIPSSKYALDYWKTNGQ